MTTSPDVLSALIGPAIRDAVGSIGQVATRWLTVLEVMDADGQRVLVQLSDDDLTLWDAVGMLTFSLASVSHTEPEDMS